MDPVSMKVLTKLLLSLLQSRAGRKILAVIAVGLLFALVAAVAIPILVMAQLTAATSQQIQIRQTMLDGQCVSWDPVVDGTTRADGLKAEQIANARLIWSLAPQAKFPAQLQSRAAVVAIAAALQESTLRQLAYGHLDSLSLFQQRPSSGWGTRAEIMDPVKATLAFYGASKHTRNPGLRQIKGWENMTVAQAAQAVQRSAYPDAYAKWESTARDLVAGFEKTNQSQALTVMSYNLLGQSLYKVKWPTRSKAVTRLIRSASPDVLGVQENHQYRGHGQIRLLDLPGMTWIYPDHRNALAIRSSLGTVADKGIIRIATMGVGGATRDRFAVWVKINTSGGGLLLVNVHTEHRNKPGAARSRSRSYDRLLAGLAQVNPNNQLPVVMTGDFNASAVETRPVYRDHLVKLGSAGFFDAGRQAPANSTKVAGTKSYNGFGMRIGGKWYKNAIRTSTNADHIDYVWTQGQVRATGWQVALPGISWRMIKGKRVAFASEIGSDHWPVVARVEFGAGSIASCNPGQSEAFLPGFNGASCVPSGSAAEHGLQASARRGLRCIASVFPQIKSMGGRRASSSSTCSFSDHCAGLAVDFMVPKWNTPAGKELGWRIARWVQANAKALRVKMIIWDAKKWNPAVSDQWRDYTHPYGNSNSTLAHKDHVHVSFLAGGVDTR